MLIEDSWSDDCLAEAKHAFTAIFREAREKGMEASGRYSLEDLEKMGLIHLEQFHAWAKGLQVRTLGVELYLTRRIEKGLVYSGQIDWVYSYRQWGRRIVVIVDHKTPARAYSDAFIANDGQLTGYQFLMGGDEAKERIPELEGATLMVGYNQFIKRKPGSTRANAKGPEHVPPSPVSRSVEQMEEFITFVKAANQLRRMPGFRFAGHGFAAHCDMCDFRELCITGEMPDTLVAKQKAA